MADENMMFATEDQQRAFQEGNAAEEVVTRKFVTFRTENLLFGIQVEDVVEILSLIHISVFWADRMISPSGSLPASIRICSLGSMP